MHIILKTCCMDNVNANPTFSSNFLWLQSYRLDDWGLIPSRGTDRILSIHRVQTGSEAHMGELFPLGIKRPRREADHLPQSSAEFRMLGSIFVLPQCLHSMVLN
jgi:hypothetical protein